jgi:hypothetical protein
MSTTDSVLGREIPALDERLYSLDSDELAFLLAQIRFTTESALKGHLLDIQAKAYKVRPSKGVFYTIVSCSAHSYFLGFPVSLHKAFQFYKVSRI